MYLLHLIWEAEMDDELAPKATLLDRTTDRRVAQSPVTAVWVIRTAAGHQPLSLSGQQESALPRGQMASSRATYREAMRNLRIGEELAGAPPWTRPGSTVEATHGQGETHGSKTTADADIRTDGARTGIMRT